MIKRENKLINLEKIWGLIIFLFYFTPELSFTSECMQIDKFVKKLVLPLKRFRLDERFYKNSNNADHVLDGLYFFL